MAQPQPTPPPSPWPTHLLTVSEYLELGEIEPGYSELVEGRVVMTPSPWMDHNVAAFELALQLRPFLPPHLEIRLDTDVDLELVPPDEPGFSRRPDLIVVSKEARTRQRREGGIARASDVALVVEMLSPGSRRTDHVIKRGEYADAGVPHYWIVDLSGPVTMVACHLAGEFGYVDGGTVAGRFSTTDPFPVEVDLDALCSGRDPGSTGRPRERRDG
ncbi:MAG: Uma2 family endonuclease [Actinomycetota bacterium]|nr:Uma2 family endonuclease [Actinomycetota bacterium]